MQQNYNIFDILGFGHVTIRLTFMSQTADNLSSAMSRTVRYE